MAKAQLLMNDDIFKKLTTLGEKNKEIAEEAIYEAAKIVADRVKKNLEALPEDKYGHLPPGETFKGVPKGYKKGLISSFGISKIEHYSDGAVNVVLGFDGYSRYPTKKYPKGVPHQLIARSVESGSSIQQKHPFFRRAVNATKKKALEAMDDIISKESGKILKQ
jgi:HK97 gp10 family phage protein